MKFLTHDVNRKLLVLILMFLMLFIIFTIYYEKILRSAVEQRNQNDERLSALTAQIVLQKLNDSVKSKQIALVDKAVLEEKYSSLVDENNKLRETKSSLEGQVALLKSELEYQKVKFEGPTEQFLRFQKKNTEIDQLKAQIGSICARIQSLNLTDNNCK